jgi:hypothetical protein
MSNDKGTKTIAEGEEQILEILSDFANALEAATLNIKRQITDLVNLSDCPSWNPDKIKWEQAQGASGPYERSEDLNSPDHKALLEDLAAHQGKLSHEGYFYWAFQNGFTIGRKKRK